MMGKGSFVKITAALVITLCYVFLFGSTEKIESISNSRLADTEGGEKADGGNTSEPAETAAENNTETTPYTVSINNEPVSITFPEYSDLDVAAQVKPFELNAAVTVPAGYAAVSEDAVSGTAETSATEKDYVETTTTTAEAETTTAEPVTEHETETVPPETAPPETTSAESAPTESETAAAQTEETAEPQTSADDAALSDAIINIPSNADAGELTVRYNGSGGSVTGDAAEILAQVVMGEIGGSFNEEAIKAQAVAAYTYIKYYNDNGNVPYVAVRTPNDKVKNCVNQVLGEAVYYNGALIQAVYGASTAGYTSSAKNVWGIDYPYLQSVRCELDSLYDPNYGVMTTFTSEEIRNKVRSATGIELDGDPGTWFAIKEHVDNVYVGSFSIGGNTEYVNSSGDTVEITGRVMRENIMDFGLRSASFEVSYSADTDKFTFTTYGYGHGVGLSQHGANNLANYWGYGYKEILSFYYPGCVIG